MAPPPEEERPLRFSTARSADDSGSSPTEQFSEAEEDFGPEEVIDDHVATEDEDGEDLFGPNMERDYEADPTQDHYDPEMLDDSAEHTELTATQRAMAEREIRRRERQEAQAAERGPSGGLSRVANLFANFGRVIRGEGGRGGSEGDLMGEEEEDEEEADEAEEALRRRERFRQFQERCRSCLPPDPVLIEEAKAALPDPEAPVTTLTSDTQAKVNWEPRIADLLSMIFEGFLWHQEQQQQQQRTVQNRLPRYIEALERMVREEKSSLIVEYEHLANFSTKTAAWLINFPVKVLSTFEGVATAITGRLHATLYADKHVAVRFINLPVTETIRSLSVRHLNRLISIEGVCIRRSDALPRLKVVYFRCLKCYSDANGPVDERLADSKHYKKVCVNCQSTGPFMISREKTVFENYQKLVVQEAAADVPPGHVPRNKVVILLGDLVEAVRPGEAVQLTGVLEARPDTLTNARNGFPVFATWLVANAVQSQQLRRQQEASERDVRIIQALSRNPEIRTKIINSIAPSIWGHSHVKTALAMAMFGGVRQQAAAAGGAQHTIRGDINVLIIGDPSLGKSQFLKFVQQAVSRSVLTTGKGASAVGLTASVRRDPQTGDWTLEGGAFVQADGGICLIDEFDKMSDRDRVSIHEAMEQQSISISKAGIVASLRARCAVIAAANPIGGCYNPALSLSENIDLGDPVISRFDIICVVRDQAFPIHDEHLADHVLESHIQGHPDAGVMRGNTPAPAADKLDETLDERGLPMWVCGSGRIPVEYLRHYIAYARQYCRPELRSMHESKLVEFYVALRSVSAGGMPITVRHLESVVRMATANAKIRLSPSVERQDMDHAIATLLESFIQVQRHGVAAALSRRFAAYRTLACSPNETLSNLLHGMFQKKLCSGREGSASIPLTEVRLLAQILHSLPEFAVSEFLKTSKFQESYEIAQIAGESCIVPKSSLFRAPGGSDLLTGTGAGSVSTMTISA